MFPSSFDVQTIGDIIRLDSFLCKLKFYTFIRSALNYFSCHSFLLILFLIIFFSNMTDEYDE